VAVVTKPFHFEGQRRMALAEAGIQELRKHVDTLIVIPNQNLFRIANDRTTFAEAFQMADQVLYSGVRGVTDLMVMPGLINLDFADVRTVMAEMGTAMMGTGEAEGVNRALDAARGAITNPLLDIISMKGARGVLINITGGFDMTLYEVDAAANEIRAEVDAHANIILGSTFDEGLEGRMRVSVVATGIDDEAVVAQNTVVPAPRRATEGFTVRSRADVGRREDAEAYEAPVEEPAEKRRGFGFFGFLRGSSGGGEASAREAKPVEPEELPRPSGDQPSEEELEIPAFLRRQMTPR
jgi:cell division protein FtsZ